MAEKLITKSFERLLDKGKHRGFITYEELGKSLGKRNSTVENIDKALLILVDEKITLVEKNLSTNPIKRHKYIGSWCKNSIGQNSTSNHYGYCTDHFKIKCSLACFIAVYPKLFY